MGKPAIRFGIIGDFSSGIADGKHMVGWTKHGGKEGKELWVNIV